MADEAVSGWVMEVPAVTAKAIRIQLRRWQERFGVDSIDEMVEAFGFPLDWYEGLDDAVRHGQAWEVEVDDEGRDALYEMVRELQKLMKTETETLAMNSDGLDVLPAADLVVMQADIRRWRRP